MRLPFRRRATVQPDTIGVRRSLILHQSGSVLTVTAAFTDDTRPGQLWIHAGDDERFPLAEFRPDPATPGAVRAVVDLADPVFADRVRAAREAAAASAEDATTLAGAVAAAGGTASADEAEETGDADAFREEGVQLRLFVDLEAPAQSLVPGRQSHDRLPDEEELAADPRRTVHGAIALGRFPTMHVDGLAPVTTTAGTVAPAVTRYGNVVLNCDWTPRPYASVHIDEARVRAEAFVFRGRIYTRQTRVRRAHLVLTGRETGQRVGVPLQMERNEDYAQTHWGHGRYDATARIPLTDLLRELDRDDLFDVHVESDAEGHDDVHRARVGRSRYLVRMRADEGWASEGGTSVLVSPYYTFKAKKLSLRVELFETAVLEAMLRGIKRKGRRSGGPVWLIGEQSFKAQDTGLAYFRHLRTQHPEIDAYYVIERDAADRVNLEGLDHVVDYRSQEHVDLMFRAERVAGSHHPDYVFPSRSRMLQKAIDPIKIFLQHGVIGIRRLEKLYGRGVSSFDTDLFIVSSDREKEYIVSDLGYRDEEVVVTGLSRFDSLLDGQTPVVPGQILVMPTWREWIHSEEQLLESDYLQQWSAFLHDERLHALLEAQDAHLVLHLHPNMRMFADHFTHPRIRVVRQGEVPMQQLIKESAALVTDYSSVGFDMSFLHRPVFYFQFDARRFLSGGTHLDMDDELPGPRYQDAQSLVTAVADTAARGFAMEPRYRERADRLLTHRDLGSSERIVQVMRTATHRTERVIDRYGEVLASAKRLARRQKQYLPVMKRAYRLFQTLPVDHDLLVFEAGLGRQVNDSPRAIYDELVRRGDTRTKVWVHSGQPGFTDPHTRVVKKLSPEYFWYMARARYWISNQNLPHYLIRRPECTYLQTWHGTPLKRMLHDLDEVHGRDEGYRDRVTTAIAQWTHLLSPSPFATQAFASAFRHNAHVLELGYPRNDALSAPDADAVRARVRENLGIPEGRRAVLYTPTFRDNLPAGRGRFHFRPPFELSEMADALGPDTVLLVRLHVVIKGKPQIPEEYADRIIDVTKHRDLNELFLASDALVTDYSSAFFDYAILDRPIIFFAYDLEEYRDQLRGFYLDFPADLPGPVVTEVHGLTDALGRDMSVDPQRRRLFRERFSPQDDGHAAARVVDRLLGG